MATAERLAGYYPFSDEVLSAVSEVADSRVDQDDYKGFLETHLRGIFEGDEPFDKKTLIDIRPKEHDPRSALIIHLAMGQPLDPNNLYQIAAIASVQPNKRIIAAANPSGPQYSAPEKTKLQRKQVSKGVLFPMIAPVLLHATTNGVEETEQYGYSFGADLAAEAGNNHIDVTRFVAVEPSSVVKRRLIGLGWAFGSSNGALGGYVEKSGSEFLSARKDSLGMLGFFAGIGGRSNIAVANNLKRGGFEARMSRALECNPDALAAVIWGSDSELALDEPTAEIVGDLDFQFPNRVKGMRLAGQRHALANDVWLQAALAAEGLGQAA